MSNGNHSDDEEDFSFTASYKKLPEQSVTTVRFFDKGSGERYGVYGKDAEIAAKCVFQNSGVIKSFGNGSSKLEYVNINRSNFETFVRDLLLVKQYRVEVYVNNATKKGSYNWVAEYKGSPGNLTQFEDLLLNCGEVTVNNGVIGIKIGSSDKSKLVGVAHVNMNESELNLVEFIDNDSLCNFEAALVQLAPKEAVIGVTSVHAEDYAKLKKILHRNGVLINERKPADFDTKDIVQDLGRLLQLKNGSVQNVAALADMDKKFSASALCGVIKYLELLSGDEHLNHFKIIPFDFGLYVKMDAAACKALHLSLNNLEVGSQKASTLTSIIDVCRTAQGHRLLAQYLKQPLLSKEKLDERLDITEMLVDDVLLRQSIHDDHLRRIPDCQLLSRKFLRHKAGLQDCYKAYLCIKKIPKLIEDLKSHESSKKNVLFTFFIEPLETLVNELSRFIELIEETLDLVKAEDGDYVVKPEFEEGLQELRNQMDEIEHRLAEESYQVARHLQLEVQKTLKLETNSIHGYHFRVTLKDETCLRNKPEYTTLSSKNSGVLFVNSTVESLNSRYAKKRHMYEESQKSIIKEVIGVVAGYSGNFEQLGNIVSSLDVFTSFAVLAANSPTPYVRPTLLASGSGRLKFDKLRHPCVENQPGVDFIPNDVHFEKGSHSFFIVTGPNMGGKSTFLRSVGVATLLAHIGCFVPAEQAEVSIVDAILARVGACDFLSKGVSTFQAEMIETAFITKTATSNSLVLIDELGRGTSTCDGYGLCWAISEYLAKKIDCYCVLATHFHELALLADEVKSVQNVHVKAIADENGVTMLYKIEKGPCDRSFGLHVAEKNEFPTYVLEDARVMADVLEDFDWEDYEDESESSVAKRQQFKKEGQQYMEAFNVSAEAAMKELEGQEMSLKDLLELYKQACTMAKDNPHLRHILKTVEAEVQSLVKADEDELSERNSASKQEESSDRKETDNQCASVEREVAGVTPDEKFWVVVRNGVSTKVRRENNDDKQFKSVDELKERLKTQKFVSRAEWKIEFEAVSHKTYPFPDTQ